MAKQTPVEYAEQTLGVHIPYAEATFRLARHKELGDSLTEYRKNLRSAKQRLADRKMAMTSEAHFKWPDAKITERKEHLRVWISEDSECSTHEGRIEELQSEIDAASAEQKHHELGLHVLTARMTELGGLLQFYAVAKASASTALTHTSHSEQKDT